MITMSITCVSSTTGIAAADLPVPFQKAIAASATGAFVCRVTDLTRTNSFTGLSAGDDLQRMVQANLITISVANLAATLAKDVQGEGISNET